MKINTFNIEIQSNGYFLQQHGLKSKSQFLLGNERWMVYRLLTFMVTGRRLILDVTRLHSRFNSQVISF